MSPQRKWKEFETPAARIVRDDIRSSINPVGEITFDLATYRKMGEPQAITLLYEESTRTIGLKAASPDDANAVLVRIRHALSNRVIRSKPFLKENNIEVPATMRFPYPYLEDNVLILDMRTAVKWGRGEWAIIRKRRETKLANDEIRAERAGRRAERKKELEDLRHERQRLTQQRNEMRKSQQEADRRNRQREQELERVRRDLARRLGQSLDN